VGLSNRSATLFVRSGGLKFKGNSTTETGYGYINFYGQDVPSGVYATYSVLTDKGLYKVTTGSSIMTLPSGILLYIASGRLALRIPGNLAEADSELFIAAKVEIGTYQTLAHNEGTEDNPNWVLNEIPDWNEVRYKCNPTIGSNLATVEYSSTVSKQDGYQQGDYLVYNGQLYKVTASTISQGETLTPGTNIQTAVACEHIVEYKYNAESGVFDLNPNVEVVRRIIYTRKNNIASLDIMFKTTGNIANGTELFKVNNIVKPKSEVFSVLYSASSSSYCGGIALTFVSGAQNQVRFVASGTVSPGDYIRAYFIYIIG